MTGNPMLQKILFRIAADAKVVSACAACSQKKLPGQDLKNWNKK
jgi:hypothetical protein